MLHRWFDGVTARDAFAALADILIVYYLVYRVLLLIKGTRAAQMLLGLLLIGIGFFAAKRLELTTVSWLLDNFINYFIIIIIVVFQYDIRRGLVRIGQNLFRIGRTYEETHVFEEIVEAAAHLARARIGALIVLQREADLSEFVETGRVVDAKVTRELLVALFLPSRDNELHDGAVVISNLRIQQAAALLPLSRSASLDKQLGTRHRAAIGLTDETDAVCVVVSEERGEISLCLGGQIARDLEPAALRKALLGLFLKRRGAQGDAGASAASRAVSALTGHLDDEAPTTTMSRSGIRRSTTMPRGMATTSTSSSSVRRRPSALQPIVSEDDNALSMDGSSADDEWRPAGAPQGSAARADATESKTSEAASPMNEWRPAASRPTATAVPTSGEGSKTTPPAAAVSGDAGKKKPS
jgi:uncharacterized protein (TIGR00159 family)